MLVWRLEAELDADTTNERNAMQSEAKTPLKDDRTLPKLEPCPHEGRKVLRGRLRRFERV